MLSLIGPDADERRRGTGLRVVGDAEVAQRFRELLSQAQPDAEEELARVIGDVAAHQVATFARGFLEDWEGHEITAKIGDGSGKPVELHSVGIIKRQPIVK